jgi:hypothetical protein
MLTRPLQLSEVLEEEHIALYGREWRLMPSDVLEANEAARAALEFFPHAQYKTIPLCRTSRDLTADRKEIADDLNLLVDGPALDLSGAALSDDERRRGNRELLDRKLEPHIQSSFCRTRLYDRTQVRDPLSISTQWQAIFGLTPADLANIDMKEPNEQRTAVARTLNAELNSTAILTVLTSRAKAGTMKLVTAARAESECAIDDIRHINRMLLDDAFGHAVQSGDETRLAYHYEVVHARGGTSALCISGGGIRSATFALGVLQSLARRNLLDKFDYLSTVSGGGYIGGWLSSWMRRHRDGPRGVAHELSKAPEDKLRPEPRPLQHLREFSNYLTPRLGALSGDTLTVAAIYVRNLLLNWFVLVPLLLFTLAIPRLIYSLYYRSVSADVIDLLYRFATMWRHVTLDPLKIPVAQQLSQTVQTFAGRIVVAVNPRVADAAGRLAHTLERGTDFPPIHWMRNLHMFDHTAMWVSSISLISAAIYIGRNRPISSNPANAAQSSKETWKFFKRCLGPLLIAAIALTAAWARYTKDGTKPFPFGGAILIGLLPLGAGIVYYFRYRRSPASRSLRGRSRIISSKILRELIALSIAGVLSVCIALLLAKYVFPRPYVPIDLTTFPSPIVAINQTLPISALYVCFAVPVVLFILFSSASLFIGLSSDVNEDYDREWWARMSGYVFGAMCVWVVLSATVIFGPVAIHLAPRALTAVGGISGVVAVVLGRSSKTAAKKGNAGQTSAVSDVVAKFAAPIFLLFLLSTLSLATGALFAPPRWLDSKTAGVLSAGNWTSSTKSAFADLQLTASTPSRPLLDQANLGGWEQLRSFEATQALPLSVFMVALAALAFVSSWYVNANKFSMHGMYRNRLIRAYLGASRSTRNQNPLTGFDPYDDMPMHALRPELLWASSFVDFKQFAVHLRKTAQTDVCFSGEKQTKHVDFLERLRRALRDKRLRIDDDGMTEDQCFLAINRVLLDGDLTWAPAPRPVRTWSMPKTRADLKAFWRQFRPSNWFTPDEPIISMQMKSDPERLRRNRLALDCNFPHEIYPFGHPHLHCADIRSVDALKKALHPVSIHSQTQTPVSFGRQLGALLRPSVATALQECDPSSPAYPSELERVLADLNRVMTEYDFETFAKVDDPFPADQQLIRRNRVRLERELKDAVHPFVTPRPMHVINIALNLVSGDNLAWQERKAESFTVSPLHAGNAHLGYRDSTQYGDGRQGISLGTAVTISGAAVSPNMGYHSSGALAFLLTLFNVRLGWWLGNPGPHGEKTWSDDGPHPAVRPLIAEATGSTNDQFEYVYLSDGGHFENFGLYEMVLRRRHYIVISDAGCDPHFTFDDLGNAIRKIRTDLGVPIEIDQMFVFPRNDDDNADRSKGRYCAVGRIRYTCVDPNGVDGEFIYIKPTIYMNEPKDVYNYARQQKAFPHETTGDQWFSESQFESYRVLGGHTIDRICGGDAEPSSDEERAKLDSWTAPTIADFFSRAKKYATTAPDAPKAPWPEDRRKDGERRSATFSATA